MKILIFEDSSQTSYGGGQKISKIVIESLTKHHKLYISDYTNDSLFLSDISELVVGKISLSSKYFSNKVLNRIFQFIFFPLNLFLLYSYIRKNKIDLFYVTTKLSLITAFILHKVTRINYVYHAHMSFNVNKLDKFFTFFLRDSVLVIAVSEFVKSSILTLHNHINVEIIYNPIEFKLGLPKNINRESFINIAFFGTIKKEKGVDIILDVAKNYIDTSPNINFLIFGDGSLKLFLDKNKSKNVELFGHISDVEFYLDNHVHILLLPSIIPEACPTIILQAFSKGIPVITTNIGGQNEIIKNHINGFVVPINDSCAIAEKINFIISDPDIYYKISLNNLETANSFNDITKFKIQVLRLFHNIS